MHVRHGREELRREALHVRLSQGSLVVSETRFQVPIKTRHDHEDLITCVADDHLLDSDNVLVG